MSRMDDLHDAAASAEIHDLMAARMVRTSPVLEETWRYWNAKRVGGDLPRRDALEPRAMDLIIGHSMILDRVRPGTVRIRVAGRIPNALMGMETRGLPIRAFFDLMQRGEAAELVEAAFTTPATVDLDLRSEGEDGVVSARMLVLPLLDREGDVSKALAAIVPDRLVTDGPRRFRIARQTSGPLTRPSAQPAPPAKDDPRAEMALRLERMVEVPDDVRTPMPDVPYLRLVK